MRAPLAIVPLALAALLLAACGGDDSSSAGVDDTGATSADSGSSSDPGGGSPGFVERDPGPAAVDRGAGTDPGAAADPGGAKDPGAARDPGAAVDPGGQSDPGAGSDPGKPDPGSESDPGTSENDPGGQEDPGPANDPGDTGCEGPMTGEMIVNEWLLSPAQGATGDANCDGTRNAVDDELIELVNVTSRCLDIGEATIATSSAGFGSPRFTFPAGTTVPPGGAVLVFGGDTPTFDGSSSVAEAHCTDLGDCSVQVFSAFPGSLAFAPEKEWVVVNSRFGIEICQARCGEGATVECPKGESLTRSPDGDGSGALVPHTGRSTNPQSPGRKADGACL